MAEWIRQQASTLYQVGSNPAGRAKKKPAKYETGFLPGVLDGVDIEKNINNHNCFSVFS